MVNVPILHTLQVQERDGHKKASQVNNKVEIAGWPRHVSLISCLLSELEITSGGFLLWVLWLVPSLEASSTFF